MPPERLRERLLRANLCTNETLVGCSDADLAETERTAGCELPEDYKEVMRVIGRGAGDFESDVEMFYPTVVDLTERARNLEAGAIELPDDAFVFAQCYWEQVLYLRLGTPESPVYRWRDGEVQKVFESYGDFIAVELAGHEELSR